MVWEVCFDVFIKFSYSVICLLCELAEEAEIRRKSRNTGASRKEEGFET